MVHERIWCIILMAKFNKRHPYSTTRIISSTRIEPPLPSISIHLHGIKVVEDNAAMAGCHCMLNLSMAISWRIAFTEEIWETFHLVLKNRLKKRVQFEPPPTINNLPIFPFLFKCLREDLYQLKWKA